MEESLKIDRMSFAKKRQRDMESFSSDRDYPQLARKQAERISSLEEENRRMREALEWYGEQSRLARLIHSEGDKGRHAIADDGGQRARAALSQEEKP